MSGRPMGSPVCGFVFGSDARRDRIRAPSSAPSLRFTDLKVESISDVLIYCFLCAPESFSNITLNYNV